MHTFKIGRDPSNNLVIVDGSVSAKHALIEFENNSFIIKDLESKNGTFVNGNAIVRKKFGVTDKIKIGLVDLNTHELHEKLKLFLNQNKIDFTVEFEELKVIHKNYRNEIKAIEKNLNIKRTIIRISITLVLMGLAYFLFQNPISTLLVGVISGGLASIFIGSESAKDKRDEIQLKYSFLYKCPKCETDLTKYAWTYWQTKGSCPNNNCDAKWK